MPRSIREIAVVLILLGGGVLILFTAPKGREQGPEVGFVYTLIRPAQQVVAGFHGTLVDTWRSYVALVGVQSENKALKDELGRLRGERIGLLNAEKENIRLKKLLNLRAANEFPSLVAQVIGEDSAGWSRSLFINRGSEDGVMPDMAVAVAEGIVGRVTRCSSGMAQIVLITDPGLSVDCRLIRTRDRGVLTGSLDGGCVLRYLDLKSDVKTGDEVITSGLDRVFPKGLPVGKIESVRKGSQGLFLEAQVKPAADFSGVEEVIVVLGRPGGFDVQTGLEEKR
jgi:rod shape-determining protein MreC